MKEDNLSSVRSHIKFLHSLKIIHGDIKNENIMWSPSCNSNVLVDFGLSMFLEESVGHSTFTKFFGTFEFCSPEMKKLFHSSSYGYVDLYYNDLYAFENIKKGSAQIIKSEIKKESS